MGKLELHTVEVHIWKLRWRELETFWNRYKPILEKEECQKAKHYRFHEDKMRYLAGKIAVRMFLKEYSGEPWTSIPYGRPLANQLLRVVNNKGKEHLQELLAVQITEDMPIYEVYDDSIKMFQVLSKINNGFHINLGMIDLVMCDTVDKLIEKITLESKNVVNIVGEEQLSLIQQSYWIGREQEFYGASNSTHLYLEVHHNLDLMKLEKVIRTLIKRHGALRSIIKEEKQFIFEEKMRKKILAQTILFYMNKKGVLLKDIPCTLNQILKCLSVNTDNNDIIYRWIELLKKYNYVTETDGIYVCKIEIYEKGLKYGWEEVEYLWKGKLESPLVLDYIINNIKNWDKLIQKEQQATLLLFEQGEDIYADALYKETKILQYLNHSLSKKVLGYLYENANATILEIGAGTGATSDKVLSDIRENKFEEHIVYFYTDISRFFLQRAKERYKECDGKIEMHYQTLDIDEAFSSQLPSNFQADIVIAVGVLNNSVNTDKCIYEINSVMKPGGILLIIETVEDVPDILITQSFMMTEPKDQRKATNTMFLNRKQWLEILEENGFCNSEEFPGYGEYLEVLGQKLFYCTKE